MYGSFRGVPLTVTRPCVSQHLTVSPPTATTRLMRSLSLSDGSRPIQVSPSLICLMTTGSWCGAVFSPASQSPGSLNTTTSPRCGLEPNHGVSLSTATRSPTWIVFSIEPDGITNACTRNVFRTRAMRTATPTRSGISLTAERLLLRLTLRWSLRRSARLRPVGALPPARRTPVGRRFCATVSVVTPRGFPRLPMGTAGGGHARVGAGRRDAPDVRGGPDHPVGPPDHRSDRHHAAARRAQMVT